MALTAILFVQSCKDDENIEPAPSVSLDASSGAAVPGGSVTINATVNAPNGGQSLVVYVAGAEVESYDIAGAKDFDQAYTYTIPAGAVIGATVVISFQAVDSKNYPSAIANYMLTVGDPVVALTGVLTTQTLTAGQPYLIKGQTFIPSGVTLTIPAGTVIKGDKASKGVLIVQPGGKLIANGTAASPVVFTSAQSAGERDRGDWGGIVLLGDAWVNQAAIPAIEGITPTQTYGNITSPATNEAQNAGTLTYVRIEYAGIELTPNNETNSLTMGGVGSGTTIDNVQVSFGGDDGFEWFGGSVNAKHLVSLSTWDDDFDTDFGWGGKVQFGLAVRNPFFADQSGSNSFECDNGPNANDTNGGAAGYSRGVFSNITVLGPRETNARSISANYANAIHIRRRTAISIFNSFFSGFRLGLRVDDDATYANLVSGAGKLAYNVLSTPAAAGTGSSATASDGLFVTGIKFTAANDGTIDNALASGGNATPIANYWTANNNVSFNNVTATTVLGDAGVSPSLYWAGQNSGNYPSNPNFGLVAGVAGANNLNTGANFGDAKLSGIPFFEVTTYKGAFGTTDWTDGWTEFQPLNKAF
ncbi:MAG: hypothetical protein H7Y31_13485, partial [Chitinophagaceae bacterium]|nr:hypothetical protein [Chitinophagaceae bacterium]